MCGTVLQFKDNHLSILRQTHPKAWESCMEHFGYREQLYKLFKIKRNPHIYDAFTDDATKARVIERFGDSSQLLDIKPCVYDDYGELVELSGTGLEEEYDAEVLMHEDGQLQFV